MVAQGALNLVEVAGAQLGDPRDAAVEVTLRDDPGEDARRYGEEADPQIPVAREGPGDGDGLEERGADW